MSLIAPRSSPEYRFQALLREARNGSSEARWLVVQLFRNVMLAVAREEIDPEVHARESPSDIVQETIVEAQRDLHRFHGVTEGEMQAWLKQVLRRNILNLNLKYRTKKRDRKRERPIDPQSSSGNPPIIKDPGPSPSAVMARRERSKAIEMAIGKLPTHYAQIIELRYRNGLTYEQIALIMGRTEGATRRLWSRALHELSRQLKLIDQ